MQVNLITVFRESKQLEKALDILFSSSFPIEQISIIIDSFKHSSKLHASVTSGYSNQIQFGEEGRLAGIFNLLIGSAIVWVPDYGQFIAAGHIVSYISEDLSSKPKSLRRSPLIFLEHLHVPSGSIYNFESSLSQSSKLLILEGSKQEIAEIKALLSASIRPTSISQFQEASIEA